MNNEGSPLVFILKNSKKYSIYIIRITLILFGAALAIFFVKRELNIFLFILVFEILFLFRKYLSQFIIDNKSIKIVYYILFIKKCKEISLSDVSLSLNKKISVRGAVYYAIPISEKGKVIYTLDSRDGNWSIEELQEMMTFYNHQKSLEGAMFVN